MGALVGMLAEVAGIEPTGRGSPVPLVLKTREATRPLSPPFASLAQPDMLGHTRGPNQRPQKGHPVKKLFLLLIVLAIGAAVAYKVREV